MSFEQGRICYVTLRETNSQQCSSRAYVGTLWGLYLSVTPEIEVKLRIIEFFETDGPSILDLFDNTGIDGEGHTAELVGPSRSRSASTLQNPGHGARRDYNAPMESRQPWSHHYQLQFVTPECRP
jgi:hypothetical protein